MTAQLRYALQHREGLRWRTVRAFTPERQEFRVVEKMMEIAARQHGGVWRVLLTPFNVLAASAA